MGRHVKTMEHPFIPAKVRDWLYPVATAVVALGGFYGLIEQEAAPLWVGLVAAILGTGTATAYRPSKTLPHEEADN